jgi:uncharacterized RDD family membrane protein YckC
MTKQTHLPGAVALQGHRAGFASRAAAAAIDLAVITVLELACLLFAALVRYLVQGPPFGAPSLPPWLSAAAAAGIPIAYLAAGWATAGRTVGMQVLGLRLLGRSGGPPLLAASLLRAALCIALPIGLLWILVSRRNASIQDLALGTAVIYDWSYGPLNQLAARSPPDRASNRPRVTARPSRLTMRAPAGPDHDRDGTRF